MAWCVLAAVATGAAPAAAQDSPSDVAAAFFKAVAEERWLDAARHLDVAALDRYRREQIAAARLEPRRPPRVITAEELLRQDPEMPRAVAEYHARKANERIGEPFDWVAHEFADVSGIEALAALPPEEAAARWLQARDLRWGARRAAEWERARGCQLPPEAGQNLPAPTHRIIAAATVDSTTAYVLYDDEMFRRAHPDADAATYADGPRVMILRRRSGPWRILPRQGLLGGMMGISFTAAECPRESRPPR